VKFDWQGSDKPFAPSAERNTAPILEVLKTHFSQARRVLEIGSGTGQHAVHFASVFSDAEWQTSDVEVALPGIRRWLDEAQLPNLPPPLCLNVNGPWPVRSQNARYDAVFTANTLHIMSWPEVQSFFSGLTDMITEDALLAVYGPFNYNGAFTSDSNRAFDEILKRQSPSSGIRDFESVDALAASIGLKLIADHPMPANNRTLVWRRQCLVGAIHTGDLQ
jgi:cyclopropane fatty-acyl-phospholipid synthase-like methyltransferase